MKNLPKDLTVKVGTTNFIDMTNAKFSPSDIDMSEDKSENASKSELLENFDNKINEIDKKTKMIRDENVNRIVKKKEIANKEKSKEKLTKKEEEEMSIKDDKKVILSNYDLREIPNELLTRKVIMTYVDGHH